MFKGIPFELLRFVGPISMYEKIGAHALSMNSQSDASRLIIYMLSAYVVNVTGLEEPSSKREFALSITSLLRGLS